jgi:formylglycine-generating enzyme required for sulfatase activity
MKTRIEHFVVAFAVCACVAGAHAQVTIETVTVGNPGNAGELSGNGAGGFGQNRVCGAVNYVYKIGKFEITAGQYTAFLNAVADDDIHELYNPLMWNGDQNSIERTGSSPNYQYSVAPAWVNRPVSYVSWGDAARFANWMHNGQPTGPQGLSTTEDGSYYLNGAETNAGLLAIVRKSNATWVIPSEDEWYKAAYHKNDGVTGNYWDYPTRSNTVPTAEAPPGANTTNGSANYFFGGNPVDPTNNRTVVGAYIFKPSDSPYGTFDQGGNVSEWNEAVQFETRGYRGGDWGSLGSNLHAAARGFGEAPQVEVNFTGFRVADVTGAVIIPTVSQWGVVAMALLVLTAGTIVWVRRGAAFA